MARSSTTRFGGVGDREVFLLLGLIQGLLFYALSEADWFAERPVFGYSLWVAAVAWPTLFLLTFRREAVTRVAAGVSAFVGVLVLLAMYTGWQATPVDVFPTEQMAFSFIASMLVAIFVALLHLQATIWRGGEEYAFFFTLSWRNCLRFGLSLVLAGCFWLVLNLWGALFSAIGIEFFTDLFEKRWFWMPVLAAVCAFGLYSFGSAISVIDRIAALLERLIWILLPLLLSIAGMFLATLAFVGLQPLWDTDQGTSLLMASSLILLFFLNAVYQTGARLPYGALMHRLVSAGLVLVPILTGLAAWGLALRVDQYGWTVPRFWAALILILLAAYSIAYACIIIAGRLKAWPGRLAVVNRNMSWVVVAALLLANSPLLDFRVLSANSQFARLDSGEISLEQFDFHAVRTSMARAGHLRMEALIGSLEEDDPEIAANVRGLLARDDGRYGLAERRDIVLRPEPFEIPEGLLGSIGVETFGPPDLLFQVDLGGGPDYEYVSVRFEAERQTVIAACWRRRDDSWANCGDMFWNDKDGFAELQEEISAADFEALVPDAAYKNLRVGKTVLQFNR